MSIAVVEINRKSILHNLDVLKNQAPQSALMAIVKANAYGHGVEGIAKLLQDKVSYFGVARVSEALFLRKLGINTPIVLLEGFFPHDDVADLIDFNLQPVIHASWQIDALNNIAIDNQITAWFKIDTGMHRLGFHLDEAQAEFNRLANCQVIRKSINIISHFSSADEFDSAQTNKQNARLDAFIHSSGNKSLINKLSIAASGGILHWPDSHRDMIRAGIALYGVSPFNDPIADLKPVMTFKSELIAVRKHKKGQAVGYGQIWTSHKDTLLGVVAMGYGDGYPRNIAENTPVVINGRRVPIVGRVSMDMIVIDLGIDSLEKPGDEVIFWGKQLPVEEIAKHTGISAYELLTRLTSRAKIHYID
ncbi:MULTISPECIES: alanine racemase [unclassified Gilliamella]|uniref:alanine racemase n=1 Tax=unclassified Gilliamella TaxID=2685620 RepID=UPI00226A94DB|nr:MULTISPECIES: alanine racemase [unclassified Gilliamella]MCX8642296.1 alanine racemase [Gilliamella sp. B3835]MCX8707694.1 alanine racemase [Gilliamella sp. B3783]MCX8709979.1 alanine racemase [Gilliamella sp. B3780]MCX8713447.1 alanine racemase [Gilliamella sp. B3781]MCX8716677.1 alanine racemase [Gilliamella sp. B3784]